MRTAMKGMAVAAVVATLAVVGVVWAQQAGPTTIITIPEMDCPTCAKLIGDSVAKVPGIAKIEYSVETRKLFVHPHAKAVLSPRILWEACEKVDKPPSRLDGPSGTYTKKPK